MMQDASYGYTTRLRLIILFLTFLVFLQTCVFIVHTWNYPNMLFDNINQRATTFLYWRMFSHPFGMFALVAMFWLVTHMLVGVAYLIAIITTGVFAAWHILLVILMIPDWADCASTSYCYFCMGCDGPDWSFMIHFWTAVGLGAIDCLFVILTIYLRTRVEFANYLAIAADSRYNPLTTYLTTPGSMSSFPVWAGGSAGYAQVPMSNQITSDVGASSSAAVDGPGASIWSTPAGTSKRVTSAVVRSSIADTLLGKTA